MQESELLFSELLGCDRTALFCNRQLTVTKTISETAAKILRRRIKGEPIDYILGKKEFMGFEFKVTPAVLIPRPETEILVETALMLVASSKSQVTSTRILDIGTGSGNIAISLARMCKECKVTAIDISTDALLVAEENARRHNVSDRINFLKCDFLNLPPETPGAQSYAPKYPAVSDRRVSHSLWDVHLSDGTCRLQPNSSRLRRRHKTLIRGGMRNILTSAGCHLMSVVDGISGMIPPKAGSLQVPRTLVRGVPFDVIISNPPYIPSGEIDTLQPEVKYEPRIALDGGDEGLDFYRTLASLAPAFLKKKAFLIMEIGLGQEKSVKNILQKSENFEIIDMVKDYSGIDRVVVAQMR